MKAMTKKLAAAGLTLALAATAVPLTAGTADAGWRGHHGHYYHGPTRYYHGPSRYYYRHHDNGGAVAAGILGLAAGAIAAGAIANSQPVYPAPAPVYGRSDHEAYCYSKYRSYDARTDTYLGYDGYRHYCR